VLNKNVLLFPKILAMKPTSTEGETMKSSELSSSLPPSELNISTGLAGTLVERIIVKSNRESHLRGSNIMDIRKKCHETAKKNLENHEKRCTAGLLASSGQFNLGTNVLEHQRHSRGIEEEKRRQKAARAKDIYDALRVKVQAMREKNLPPEKCTVAQLNTMIQWHKHPEDAAMPNKKGEKLARLVPLRTKTE
jgi:hypothetical protein